MKATELNKQQMAGVNVLTGRFLGCTIEQTNDKTKEFESTKIAGTGRNFEFRRFGKKGDPLGTLKPRYASIAFGDVVAVVGYRVEVKDGFLREDCAGIEAIQP